MSGALLPRSLAPTAPPRHEVSAPPAVPAPLLTPAQSIAAMRVAPGFVVELVAAEPLVQAPVAAAFDEDGRLWVVEMRTYMPDADGRGEEAPGSRVVVLHDDDGDGRMDRSAVFLDGLVLPRAVTPCFGGALVIEPPGLYFCPDTDGDGRADEKRELLSGFGGRDNPEHAGNGLLRGMDNWYHLSQHGVEFRFDGERIETRPTPAHGQWGITQDDAGRLYYTPNSEPLLADLFPKHYAARNPHQASVAGVGRAVARAAAATFPIRPTPGVNRGYLEGTLRRDGTLASITAACAPALCRSGGLGEECRGDVFIAEPAGLLVKRIVMSQQGGSPRGRNAYEGSEFLASTDERFRPVNTCFGPDGALHVVDMSRGVIQHRMFLTPYLRGQIAARGLERPLTMGRIYRVRADGASPVAPRRLSAARNEELVALLAHADGWWRDTAQRLLVERGASEIAPQLRTLAASASPLLSRLHALWTLEGLGVLSAAEAMAAVGDDSPLIRAAGIRVAEPFISDPEVLSLVRQRSGDTDAGVRLQAVCTLGEARDVAGLAGALRRDGGDEVIRGAAVGGLRGLEGAALDILLADASWPAGAGDRAVLAELADAALRAGAAARHGLVERVGSMARRGDARAERLLVRVRAAQGIATDRPRPLALSAEPREWLAAAGDPLLGPAGRMAECAVWFDWPGRPAARRRRAPRALTADERALFERGRALYTACAACHSEGGRGIAGLAPSLVESALVEGPADRLAKVLLHGMEGPYVARGQRYALGLMPPAPLSTDEEFAAVMTFIRRSWGNAADPVTPALVKGTREWHLGRTRPWMAAELGVSPP